MKELLKSCNLYEEFLAISKEVYESENFIDPDFGAGVSFIQDNLFRVEPNSCRGEDQSLAEDINNRLASLQRKLACAVHAKDAADVNTILQGGVL